MFKALTTRCTGLVGPVCDCMALFQLRQQAGELRLLCPKLKGNKKIVLTLSLTNLWRLI